MTIATRTQLTILTLALSGAWALSGPARAASVTATSTTYLPIVACAGCAGSAPATPTIPNQQQLALELAGLINAERARLGCPAVRIAPGLMAATLGWSTYMHDHNYYHHADASWYAPYGYQGAMENIGGGSAEVGGEFGIFAAWMSDAAHKNNMLWCYAANDPSYNPQRIYEIGAGYYQGYWTYGMVDRLP